MTYFFSVLRLISFSPFSLLFTISQLFVYYYFSPTLDFHIYCFIFSLTPFSCWFPSFTSMFFHIHPFFNLLFLAIIYCLILFCFQLLFFSPDSFLFPLFEPSLHSSPTVTFFSASILLCAAWYLCGCGFRLRGTVFGSGVPCSAQGCGAWLTTKGSVGFDPLGDLWFVLGEVLRFRTCPNSIFTWFGCYLFFLFHLFSSTLSSFLYFIISFHSAILCVLSYFTLLFSDLSLSIWPSLTFFCSSVLCLLITSSYFLPCIHFPVFLYLLFCTYFFIH